MYTSVYILFKYYTSIASLSLSNYNYFLHPPNPNLSFTFSLLIPSNEQLNVIQHADRRRDQGPHLNQKSPRKISIPFIIFSLSNTLIKAWLTKMPSNSNDEIDSGTSLNYPINCLRLKRKMYSCNSKLILLKRLNSKMPT
jgi:hypothetical protein